MTKIFHSGITIDIEGDHVCFYHPNAIGKIPLAEFKNLWRKIKSPTFSEIGLAKEHTWLDTIRKSVISFEVAYYQGDHRINYAYIYSVKIHVRRVVVEDDAVINKFDAWTSLS